MTSKKELILMFGLILVICWSVHNLLGTDFTPKELSADLNGDGIEDVVFTKQVYETRGTSFIPSFKFNLKLSSGSFAFAMNF